MSDNVEKSLIGAILQDPNDFQEISRKVSGKYFLDPLHGEIFDAVAERHAVNGEIVPNAIALMVYANTPQCGRSVQDYLESLKKSAPKSPDLHEYASWIMANYRKRHLLRIIKKSTLAVDLAEDQVSLGQVVEELQGELAEYCVSKQTTVQYKARCIADIEAKAIEWLWQDRIPLGKLTLIAGDPGLGKSQLSLALAAIVSKGRQFPDGATAPQGSVVILNAEDDPADTIRPRLEVADADLSNTHILEGIYDNKSSGHSHHRYFDMERDLPILRRYVEHLRSVKLIIIDPVLSFFGRSDSHKATDVRQALHPLQILAEETGAAVVIVTHLNKNQKSGDALSRVMGSGAFAAVCRTAWVVARGPEDKKIRLFVPLKNNIGPDRFGFEFKVEGASTDACIATSKIEFGTEPIEIDADELFRALSQSNSGTSEMDRAKSFLTEALKSGEKRAKDLEKAAGNQNISKRTLRRAREEICTTSKTGTRNLWKLKTDVPKVTTAE